MHKPILLSILFTMHFAFCRGQNNFSPSTLLENKILSDTTFIPKDSTILYFPINSFNETSNNTYRDSFIVKCYSEQLFALKEPVVYNDSSQNEVYRFTWLRTFHNPVAIRIQKNADGYVLYWKLSNGAGGYKPGILIIDKQRVLDRKTWDEFLDKINQIDFWNLQLKRDARGTDGSQWILEGKSKNKYHVVSKWTPHKGNTYYDCCNFLLSLTDLKISGREKY